MIKKYCLVGTFDGLHYGHKILFDLAKGTKSLVVLVDNVPNKKEFIYPSQQRLKAIQQIYPHKIFYFDAQNKNITAQRFIDFINKKFGEHTFLCGSDFTLGKDVVTVKNLAKFNNVKVINIKKQFKTSIVKQYIKEGNISQTNKLLIAPYCIQGQVIRGKGFGHKLGYPTANCHIEKQQILPKIGCYAGYCQVGKKRYQAAIFIDQNLVETHIFKFNKNIYGKTITVWPQQFIANKDKAKDFNELKQLIHKKINKVLNAFDNLINFF